MTYMRNSINSRIVLLILFYVYEILRNADQEKKWNGDYFIIQKIQIIPVGSYNIPVADVF